MDSHSISFNLSLNGRVAGAPPTNYRETGVDSEIECACLCKKQIAIPNRMKAIKKKMPENLHSIFDTQIRVPAEGGKFFEFTPSVGVRLYSSSS